MKTVYVAREQDNEFRSYDEFEKQIEDDRLTTVGDVRREFASRLNIDHEMICLVDGTPVADSRVLEDGEKLYFKYPAKSRG